MNNIEGSETTLAVTGIVVKNGNGVAEPEDATLIASGILPLLLEQALREPPSLDWEQDLNEIVKEQPHDRP